MDGTGYSGSTFNSLIELKDYYTNYVYPTVKKSAYVGD